jgi:hypothetical protein
MTTAICSVYYDNLNPRVREMHRQVVEKFMPASATYHQIRANDHGSAMFRMTKQLSINRKDHDFDRIVWLDIDCIPLSAKAFTLPFHFWGCAQRANHIQNCQHLYASPFAMGITLSIYEHINYPTFSATYRGDVGEELTYSYEQHFGHAPTLLKPLHIEEQPEGGYWELTGNPPYDKFGLGTTYGMLPEEPLFYHAFQIRDKASLRRFQKKCEHVLE